MDGCTDQWRAIGKARMNFFFHEMREISLNNWENISLSKKDMLHGFI